MRGPVVRTARRSSRLSHTPIITRMINRPIAVLISRAFPMPHCPAIASRHRSTASAVLNPPEPTPLSSTPPPTQPPVERSEEHTSELQSLMRISYDVFCLKKKNTHRD